MIATRNVDNLRQYKIRFSLIAEQILAFASLPKMLREVKICLQISSKLRDNVLRYSVFSFG